MNITVELVRSMLAWCTLINMVILLIWVILLLFCHKFFYKVHSKMFNLSEEAFYKVNYMSLGLFKIGVILFNLIPYLSLRIIAS